MKTIQNLLTATLLTLATLACAQTTPATRPAPTPPTPGPKNESGLTATLTSAKESYTLTPGQIGKEFRDSLTAAGRSGRMPPTPAVDFTLTIKNESTANVVLTLGGDTSRIELTLQGPGAVTLTPNVPMTMEFRLGKPTTVTPGQTTELKLTNLNFGQRNISGVAYWTEPGEYLLTATLIYTEGENQRRVTSSPAKIKIEAPAK